jgi:glucoamylase
MNFKNETSLGCWYGAALSRARLLSALLIIFIVVTIGYAWAQDAGSARSAPVIASEESDQDLPAWINKEKQICIQGMVKNISPQGATPGAIIASPHHDYRYHWVRDAGLVMSTVTELYVRAADPQEKTLYFNKLKDYVEFARITQTTPQGPRALGEAKFNLNGTPYSGWMNPQDDGPALRTISLVRFSQNLPPNNQQLLMQIQQVVRDDLNYIVSNWAKPCFDLWEEVVGHHFHTRMVQRRALSEGAKLFPSSDPLVLKCKQVTQQLKEAIEGHWDQKRKLIQVTMDRHGGLGYKSSGIDSGVVLGVLQGYMDDGFFSPSDDRVLATAYKIQAMFSDIYMINHDSWRPGIAIGRYPEDQYPGPVENDNCDKYCKRCPEGGNPWVISTLSFAELYYRIALELQNAHQFQINATNVPFYRWVLEGTESEKQINIGITVHSQDKLFSEVTSAIVRKGDDFIARVKHHSPQDGSLNEQFIRYNGFMTSVDNLTWNYATFLNAIWAKPGAND